MRQQRTANPDVDPAQMPGVDAIRASLARAEADVAAGRVTEGEVVLAELRAMIEARRQV